MSKKQNEVEATGGSGGFLGEVYTTPNGTKTADPHEHVYGWKQISLSKRVRVQSCPIGMHQRWYGWREVAP